MSHNQYIELGLVQSTNIPWYLPSIPQPLQTHIQHFFESYVGLDAGEIISHIESVVRIALDYFANMKLNISTSSAHQSMANQTVPVHRHVRVPPQSHVSPPCVRRDHLPSQER